MSQTSTTYHQHSLNPILSNMCRPFRVRWQSSRAAKVGYHLQCRKQSLPGLVHHVQTSENHHHHHHHHHHPLHPGVMPPPIPPGGFKRGMSASTSNLDTSVRASIRSMEMEVENDRRRSDGNGRGSGVGGGGAGAGDAGVLVHSAYRQEGLIGMADYGDDEGVDGSGSGHLEEGRPMMGRMSSRHRRRSTRSVHGWAVGRMSCLVGWYVVHW